MCEMQMGQDSSLECLSNGPRYVAAKEALKPQPLSLCTLATSLGGPSAAKVRCPVAPIALADDRAHAFRLCARNPRRRSDARRAA